MPSHNTHLNHPEKAFVESKGPGYVRSLIQQAMAAKALDSGNQIIKVSIDGVAVSAATLIEMFAAEQGQRLNKMTNIAREAAGRLDHSSACLEKKNDD